jgi:hypothetical protein
MKHTLIVGIATLSLLVGCAASEDDPAEDGESTSSGIRRCSVDGETCGPTTACCASSVPLRGGGTSTLTCERAVCKYRPSLVPGRR